MEYSEGLNIIAFDGDNGIYVFLYDDNSFQELLDTFTRYAKDKELSDFTRRDASCLSIRTNQEREKIEKAQKESLRIERKSLLESL